MQHTGQSVYNAVCALRITVLVQWVLRGVRLILIKYK
jgi:hypothetical protein